MANVLQLKRGTTARRLTYTPAPGEPVVDLTQNKLYYGNGTTVGGVAIEAEDSSKVFKVLPLSTAQAYRDLASFYNSGAAVNGAIVIHLPALKNTASTMMQIKIKGYNYLTSTGAFELLCGFYQYSSTNISQFSAALLGSFPSDQVRYAKAADHTVIILGDVNTTWAYPNIHIPEVVCSYSGYTDWENGWSITIETDLSAYTVKATPTVYGGPRAKTADVLTTARTIGGVSFNGSANINLPGVNTAGNQSTTGNAATATRLATARTINGVSFDGTANITVADATKLPLTGGTISGSLNVTGVLGVSSFSSAGAYSFLNGSAAQSINTGGLLVSNSYSDASRVPVNGVYVKGQVEATGGFLGSLTGNATSATSANYLTAVDNRSLKPTDTTKTSLNNYFVSLGGLTGTANTAYGDLLVMNGYGDTSGGEVNALYFSKTSTPVIYHYRAAQGATTWGTAYELAYTSSNVASASKLQTARTFTYTGDVTGSVSFDGTANVSAAMTLANSGVTAGTYKSVTVDVKGRVTAGADVITSLVTSTSATGTTNAATTNTNTFLNIVEKVGTANASPGTSTQVTGTGTVTVSSDTAGKLTITGAQSITGNAATATKLATARTINGVAFDGTSNITIGEGNSLFLGAVQWFNGNRASIPDGWLAADGQVVSRATFPDLWAIVGTTYPSISDATWLATANSRGLYSTGNGTSTFRLPDLNGVQTNSLRGLFVRGDGNGNIAGQTVTVGTTLSDSIRNISGSLGVIRTQTTTPPLTGAFYHDSTTTGSITGATGTLFKSVGFDASLTVPTSGENRPVSAVGVWIIRASGSTSPTPSSGSPATLLANTFNGSQKIVGNLEVTGTLAFAKGFENSLNETGWQKLPGGLILQWGTASLAISTGGSVTQPVTYPIAFPNNVLHIFMSYRESTGPNSDSPYSRDGTNTGFNIGQTAGEAHTCSWLAIGW